MLRSFGPNEFLFLISAARWTVLLALIGTLGGGVLGMVVLACIISPRRWLRRAARAWISVLQGVPLLVQLLIVYYCAPLLGWQPNAWVAAGVTFSLSFSAFFGDVWRGSVEEVPAGQWEAGRALGLGFLKIFALIILPQAMKLMIPPTLAVIVQVIKNTSVASLIGIVELARTANMVNTVTFDPVKVFFTVAVLYFVVCWPLSWLSAALEARFAPDATGGAVQLLRRGR